MEDYIVQDRVFSFIESFTLEELGRLLELKRERSDHSKNCRFESASNCRRIENKFIEEMITKHGLEDPGISVLFLTIPVVESVFIRKNRNARIASVLGFDPEDIEPTDFII
jgi:hypothetical protein